MNTRCRALFLIFALCFSSVFLSQCSSVTQSVPSLNTIIGREPVTTSIKDAVLEIPHLDGWAPKRAMALASLPRDKDNNGFIITKPGFYTMEAQSYCLHAGTYGPGGGDGYIYAPLKGAREAIIGNILKRSASHPNIEQHNIQVLIWAIEAKTKITDMSPEIALTATQLLTPTEIAQINDVVVEDYVGNLVSSMIPPEVQSVLEAQRKIRDMVSSAQSTYEDIEKVAVLTGAAPWGKGSRETPSGRWSYHPDGYFVSYRPDGYPHTSVLLYAPECIKIVRDDFGRIVLLEDTSGTRIEISYMDDSQEVPGDGGVVGHAFASVRYTSKEAQGRTLNTGWTFLGIPNSKGEPAGGGRFEDMPARYQWAVEWVKKHENWVEAPGAMDAVTSLLKTKKGGGDSAFMDLPHLEYGLYQAGLNDPTDLVRRAWLYEICLNKGACQVECWERIIYDPSTSVATPGNTSRQRLGQSTRVKKD